MKNPINVENEKQSYSNNQHLLQTFLGLDKFIILFGYFDHYMLFKILSI